MTTARESKPDLKGSTVIVFSRCNDSKSYRLGNPIPLRDKDGDRGHSGHVGKTVIINGVNPGSKENRIIANYATTEMALSDWEIIKEKYKNSYAIKKGLIFTAKHLGEVNSIVDDVKHIKQPNDRLTAKSLKGEVKVIKP